MVDLGLLREPPACHRCRSIWSRNHDPCRWVSV